MEELYTFPNKIYIKAHKSLYILLRKKKPKSLNYNTLQYLLLIPEATSVPFLNTPGIAFMVVCWVSLWLK